MANSFNLTSGADTFACDIQGNVTKAGAAFGTWSVADNNTFTITPTAGGGPTSVPVQWLFNGGNQLELHQATARIFNFHNDSSVRPDMATALGVLNVAPDQNNTDFVFKLHGDWAMSQDGKFNLLFTPAGGTQSIINGLLENTASSEFVYIFLTPAPAARHYEFDFSGKWQQNGSGIDVDFVYDKENGASGTIQLPPGLTMDPVKNVLVYSYNKGTHSGTLALAGTIRVNANFSVTYIIDQQDDAGVKSTTFSIAAHLSDPKGVGEGNLHLLVKRNGLDKVFEIGGDYHGAIAGLDLTVGFNYRRTISGTTIRDTVAFNGKIVNPANGNQFKWQFTMDGHNFEVDLSAQIKLSNHVCLNAALNVTVNGNQLGISAVFGISTNCGNAPAVTTTTPLLKLSAGRSRVLV